MRIHRSLICGVALALVLLPIAGLPARADDAEATTWALIQNSSDPEVFQNYLIKFPTGAHAADAKAKYDALTDTGAQISIAPPPPPPPSSSSSASSSSAPPPDSAELASEIQSELVRVGCSTGPVDGVWGRGTVAALSDFARRAQLVLSTDAPDADTLTILRAHAGRVCTPPAPPPPRASSNYQPPPEPPPQTRCFTFKGQQYCE